MAEQGNDVLKQALRRLRWTPETFARNLTAFARELGRDDALNVKTPYKWLRGGHPRTPWSVLVPALLSRELDEPLGPEDLGWHSDDGTLLLPANAGLDAPWTASGALDTAREVSAVNPLDRRSFLVLGGAALTAPAHEWLIARPVSAVAQGRGRTVTVEVADHLDEVTGQLRQMDDQMGSGSLVDVVCSQTDYVTGLLQDGSYTDSVGQQLHSTVAELLRLAGWLSFDSDKHADAQRFFMAALHGAHSAGDRELGANILGFMSCQAKDLGKFDEAVKLADTALTGYSGASPRVSAILHMRAAQAYANANDATETERSIDAAYSSFNDTAPEHGEPEWCYWMDEAQLNEQIGYCHLRLRDWGRASSHMRTAIRLQGPEQTREGTLRLAFLADTYAQRGEPEKACEIGNKAIDTLATQVDSARCVGHVKNVSRHLQSYRQLGPVSDFRQRVEDLATHYA